MSEDSFWPDIGCNANPVHNPYGLADFQAPHEMDADLVAIYGNNLSNKCLITPSDKYRPCLMDKGHRGLHSLIPVTTETVSQSIKTIGEKKIPNLKVLKPEPECLAPYTYGSNFRPCFLEKGHTGRHSHISYGTNPVMSASSENKDESVHVSYDSNGRPLSVNVFQKGYEHCSETQRYEHSSIVVTIKGYGTKIIWPGKDGIGFVYYVDEGYTIVRLYEIKSKTCLTTKWYNGANITRDQIRSLVFDGSVPAMEAREEAKKGGKPFKATFRHLIVSKVDFEKRFKPNLFKTVSYQNKNDDSALKSIGEMLRSAQTSQTEGGSAPAAINNAIKRIKDIRNVYLKAKSTIEEDFPIVEVYAIWHNYDPDAKLIYGSYDASEPLFYHYNVFKTVQEMDECPT